MSEASGCTSSQNQANNRFFAAHKTAGAQARAPKNGAHTNSKVQELATLHIGRGSRCQKKGFGIFLMHVAIVLSLPYNGRKVNEKDFVSARTYSNKN